MTRPPAARLIALLGAMTLAFAGVVVRLGVLQTRDSSEFTRLGYDQRVQTLALSAARGEILDRERDPLAISVSASDVYANPQLVTDPLGEASKISQVLGTKTPAVERLLTGAGTFAYVERQVTPAVAQRLDALALPGIGFLPSTRRSYPAGSLGSQVVGFVGVDGTGLGGLESQYQSTLAGTPGSRTQEVAPDGQPIPQGVDVSTAAVPGSDLVTTIDRDLQYYAQRALMQAVKQNHAKGGTIIVMDPRTGSIYAMASYPWFDPNDFATADPSTMRNPALTDPFEPGSVNKVITAACAVQDHAVALNHRFTVPDRISVDGYVINDSHPHPAQRMMIGDIMAESSNVGAVKIADLLGKERLSECLTRFGFGIPTGLDFPGETAGIVPSLSDWSNASLATIAYGQGIAVSPMQMAAVYATIANGGDWVQPRLVSGTIDPAGRFLAAPASPTRRVVSTQTAASVTQMLAYVVQDGTGINAQIEGYQVAGKTGTALKVDPNTGRYGHKYVASFIGFLPASQPRVVVAAIIDEPTTIYGGVAAAPLFQTVARYAIQRLGIPPASNVSLPPHTLNLSG